MFNRTALIFEAEDADPRPNRIVRESSARTTVIVAVADVRDIPGVASDLVDDGIELVELCGGVSPVWRSRTIETVGTRAKISSVTFGIESLQAAAHFNDAYARGEAWQQAFILLEPGAKPDTAAFVLNWGSVPTNVIPVPDADAAAGVADRLAAQGVLLIELYGGFSTADIAQVIEIVDARSAVGAGSFAIDMIDKH